MVLEFMNHYTSLSRGHYGNGYSNGKEENEKHNAARYTDTGKYPSLGSQCLQMDWCVCVCVLCVFER